MSLNPLLSQTYDSLAEILSKVKIPYNFDTGQKVDEPIAFVTRSELGDIKALTGYAQRDGFFGGIATILHRIWNAVKAIFGQSDWQRAERAITNLTHRVIVLQISSTTEIITPEKIKLLKTGLNSEEFQSSLRKFLEDTIIPQIDQANATLNPFTNKLAPIVNTILTALNTEQIAANVFKLKDEFEEIAKNIPEDAPLSTGLFIFMQELCRKGFVTKEIVQTVRIFLEDPGNETTLKSMMGVIMDSSKKVGEGFENFGNDKGKKPILNPT